MSELLIDDPIEVAKLLRRLVGTWEGAGSGRFPTIDDFRYRETLRFKAHESEPHLHYEQRTWLVSGPDDGKPSHWESGFLMVLEDGSVEVLNAQQSGRVEVLSGHLYELEEDRHELRLTSTLLGNDPRMVATDRTLTLAPEELAYEARMTTNQVADHTVHLRAELRRPGG